ncbi:hypothetical protein EPK84_26420 [Sinorhizobium fredii]|nr:hypothetical protein EPK84_26420 [Sinorhizobium fredii]
MATAMATAPAIAVAARLLRDASRGAGDDGSSKCPVRRGSVRSVMPTCFSSRSGNLWSVLIPSYCIAATRRQIIMIEPSINGIERSQPRRHGCICSAHPGSVTTSGPVRVTTTVCSYCTVGARGSL